MKIIDLLKKQRSKKFINPYYRVEKSRLSIINSSLRIKIIVIEVLVLVIGLTWFFYYSTVFNVNVIDVIGARRIPKDEVTRVIRATLNEGALLRNSLNLFILDIDKLKQKLNSKYYLTSLEIIKKYPSGVDVLVVEKDYSGIWREGDSYYYIDEVGRVIERANPLEIKKSYPLIDNIKEAKFNTDRVVGEQDSIEFALRIFEYARRNQIDLLEKIDRFIVDSTDTLKVILVDGPYVMFDLTKDLEKQISKLSVLKDQKLKSDFFNKEYIDLRYGDRVYYR